MRGSIVTARRGVGTFKRPNSMAKSQPSSPRGRWGSKPGPGDLRQSIETVPAEKRVDVVPGPGGKPPLFNPNVGGRAAARKRRSGCVLSSFRVLHEPCPKHVMPVPFNEVIWICSRADRSRAFHVFSLSFKEGGEGEVSGPAYARRGRVCSLPVRSVVAVRPL